jgi:flagellar hook protein FlgE
LDGSGTLVDQRTGNRVLGQNGASITVDTDAILQASATEEVSFIGNLPAEKNGPLASSLFSASSLQEGVAASTGAAVVGAGYTIPAGETWTMELTINGGAPQSVEIQGDGTPLSAADIVSEINSQTEDLSAAVNAGEIVLTTDRSGASTSITVIKGEDGAKDLQELIGLSDFASGTESTALGTTNLNALTSNLTDYSTDDTITLSGLDGNGDVVQASFEYGTGPNNDGTTVDDLVAFINAEFDGASATYDASGVINLVSDTAGESDLVLTLSDSFTEWDSFSVGVEGSGPDVVTTSVEVFEENGTPHVLTFDYERQGDDTWNLVISSGDATDTITGGTISGINFSNDGRLSSIGSATSFSVDFGDGDQDISFDLGTQGQLNGLTQFGSPASVIIESQDGFAAGELANVQVGLDGSINGFYTNGQIDTLGNVGVATFTNSEGLESVGDSFFRATPNSGARTLTAGGAGKAGEVVAGSLESSNVDSAEEFVRLIQAQRGFQANARVITVQDELLSEIVNIV